MQQSAITTDALGNTDNWLVGFNPDIDKSIRDLAVSGYFGSVSPGMFDYCIQL
jgi:hypothetical protein